jgi:transcription-repair coupling factor (superfamily II helicase)
VIVEILNYAERVKIEEQLRAIGFNDVDSSTEVCRFQIAGIIVDIMPTNDSSIGFKISGIPMASGRLLIIV